METKNNKNNKVECPICRKNTISMDDRSKRTAKAGRRRRGKNRKDSGNDSSEESISTTVSSEKVASFHSMEKPSKEEEKKRTDMMYKHRLAAFDEDYATSLPTIALDSNLNSLFQK